MWPRRRSYPAIGALLALGAPLGLLLTRSILYGWPPTLRWVAWDLESQAVAYAYSCFSTIVVLALLGGIVGRAQDALRARSVTDELTGLHNRAHFGERLREEVSRAARTRAQLSLLILDVDHLKSINDRAGHLMGDSALRGVAQSLAETCRTTDVVARVGGDEFAVIAPATSANEALELADRIRESLDQAPMDRRIFVSVGVADLDSAAAATPDALYRAADDALYAAKAAGRNRASSAPPRSAVA
jgi:diguanylate cyclase (GGDEF)-like protein